jgi:hypothetical protein
MRYHLRLSRVAGAADSFEVYDSLAGRAVGNYTREPIGAAACARLNAESNRLVASAQRVAAGR